MQAERPAMGVLARTGLAIAGVAAPIGTIAALIAFVIGLFGHYVVAVDHSLCGGGPGAAAVSAAVAAAVYLAGAAWALGTGARARWAWPAIVLLGWGVHLVLLFALPGAHGYCE